MKPYFLFTIYLIFCSIYMFSLLCPGLATFFCYTFEEIFWLWVKFYMIFHLVYSFQVSFFFVFYKLEFIWISHDLIFIRFNSNKAYVTIKQTRRGRDWPNNLKHRYQTLTFHSTIKEKEKELFDRTKDTTCNFNKILDIFII